MSRAGLGGTADAELATAALAELAPLRLSGEADTSEAKAPLALRAGDWASLRANGLGLRPDSAKATRLAKRLSDGCARLGLVRAASAVTGVSAMPAGLLDADDDEEDEPEAAVAAEEARCLPSWPSSSWSSPPLSS